MGNGTRIHTQCTPAVLTFSELMFDDNFCFFSLGLTKSISDYVSGLCERSFWCAPKPNAASEPA